MSENEKNYTIEKYGNLSNIDKISNLYWYGVNSGIRYGIFDLYDTDLKNKEKEG